MKHILVCLLLLICFSTSYAQEITTPLGSNQQLIYASKIPVLPTHRGPADTLTLPFVDDFSKPAYYPDASKWLDRYAYVNTTLPVNPPSIGVATMDGLNQFGLPYDTTGFTGPQDADTLTSLPIDLKILNPADSVYLSFFYEAQGYGDYPNTDDKLLLQLKKIVNDTTVDWVTVWSQDGPNVNTPINQQYFKQVMIPITAANYFYKGFQFRFHNFASTSGNNDHWHIDYVRLNSARNLSDTAITDAAITYSPTTILKNYQAMPWSQFKDFQSTELGSIHRLHLKNNFNATKNFFHQYNAVEKFTGTQLSSNSASLNINASDTSSVEYSTFNITANPVPDSASVYITYKISVTSDINSDNDSIIKKQDFFNYYAYDDGTAEQAYGLLGKGAKLAIHFHLNKPDTLRAIQILFTNIDKRIDKRLFSLMVWSQLTPNETIIHEQDFLRPNFADSVNGFYTYLLDTPRAISGDFYIGMLKPDLETIEIGRDMNTDSHNNLWYNTLGVWKQSGIYGTVMMRPLIGNKIPFLSVDPISATKPTILIYPNPVENQLNIRFGPSLKGSYSIVDCTGRVIKHSNELTNTIDVSSLSNGLYILKIDETSGKTIVTKFIKQHN